MPTDLSWSELSLTGFCEGLADGAPGAAGARAAALLVASGAALAAGSQRGAPEAEGAVYAGGRADELDALRDRALGRLDLQREVFAKLERAAEGADLEKLRRRRVELALETVELAVAALRIAAVGAPSTGGGHGTDLAAAAAVLATAAGAVGPEVRRAVAELEDSEWGERHRIAAEALEAEAEALLGEVRRETEAP